MQTLRPLSAVRRGGEACVTELPPHDDPTAAALFAAVWDALTDLMGPSATASLMRRAIKRGLARHPGLSAVVIHRPGFEYEYVIPEPWRRDGLGRDELGELVHHLVPLLTELTGSIAVQRLQAVSIVARAGLVDTGGTES